MRRAAYNVIPGLFTFHSATYFKDAETDWFSFYKDRAVS